MHGRQRGAADHRLLARLRLELGPDDQRAVLDLGDALALERLEQVRREFRVGRNLLADLLEDLADLFDIGVEGDAEGQLLDHPVAAEILDLADLAIRYRRQRAALMTQRNRPDRDLLHGPLGAGRLDVFAEAEGVVDQEEQAGHHVLDQRLRAEADRQAEDAEAGDQRPDIDADRDQDRQQRQRQDARFADAAEQRDQRAQPRTRRAQHLVANTMLGSAAATPTRKARALTAPTTFHRNAAASMISATPDRRAAQRPPGRRRAPVANGAAHKLPTMAIIVTSTAKRAVCRPAADGIEMSADSIPQPRPMSDDRVEMRREENDQRRQQHGPSAQRCSQGQGDLGAEKA